MMDYRYKAIKTWNLTNFKTLNPNILILININGLN